MSRNACAWMDTSGNGCTLIEDHDEPHRFLSDEFRAFRAENRQMREVLRQIWDATDRITDVEEAADLRDLIDRSGLLQR